MGTEGGLLLPKAAIVLKDGDSLQSVLDLEEIPTKRAFKKAVKSLSLEQERFASAMRAMKLSNTLFTVAIVQVLPQVEKILNLPRGSLNKNLEIGENIMTLLTEYNISPDLLSVDENELSKNNAILLNVAKMKNVVQKAKEQEIARAKLEAEKRRHEVEKKQEIARAKLELEARREEERLLGLLERLNDTRCDTVEDFNCDEDDECGVCDSSDCDDDADEFACMKNIVLEEAEEGEIVDEEEEFSEGDQNPSEDSVQDVSESKDSTDYIRDASNLRTSLPERNFLVLPETFETLYEQRGQDDCVSQTIISMREGNKNVVDKFGSKRAVSSMQAAFDLLDIITRSGSLAIEDTSVHVVLASTHLFGQSLMNTLVRENENPIVRAEMTSIIAAEIVYEKATLALL